MSANPQAPWLNNYPTWTPDTVATANTTLVDLYNSNAERNGELSATYFFGKTMEYADLDYQVNAAAAGLKAFGIRPGDRVAILLPNCPQHLVAFYAITKLGAVVVEHNPQYTAHELEPLFRNHGARVAIAWDKCAGMLDRLRGATDLETIVSVNIIDEMPLLQRAALSLPIGALKAKRAALSGPAPHTVPWPTLLSSAIGGEGRNLEYPEVTPDDIALILYTSGTTGQPKGALLSHGNLAANALQVRRWIPDLGHRHERFLATLPMFHSYGFTMAVTLAIMVGAEIIMLPAPQVPLIMDIIKKRTPTYMPAVPTIYEKVMDEARARGIDLKGIRVSISGAAALPAEIVDKWENLTGGILVEGYGLTETSPVLTCNPISEKRRAGCIGLPLPSTELRIGNPDNLDETQPYGVEGELLARGPQIFQGYLDNAEATAAAFHGEWFRTGDQGVMDEDGYVRLVSRIKEIIITGGFNVYPGEVEETLAAHPDVIKAAVVGLPRHDGSEDVVACLVLREGAELDPEALKEHCRENLARYKVPRRFFHFEELAADQLGKLRRRQVQQDLLDRLTPNEAVNGAAPHAANAADGPRRA